MQVSRKFLLSGLLLSFATGLGLMWFVCSGSHTPAPVGGELLASVTSPDQAYVAKVQRPAIDGMGATISQPYQVWVEGRSGSPQRVFEADKTDGVKIRWVAGLELEVCYADAQISTFRNRFVEVDRSGAVTAVRTAEVLLRRVPRLAECPP